jgi:hypothetical protein
MSSRRHHLAGAAFLLVAAAFLSAPVSVLGDEKSPSTAAPSAASAVEAVLDDFHQAASEADEERYFGHLAPSGVFLGTDASERWPKAEFRDFVHPYFSRGSGWTYVPVERHVTVSADGSVAWFDEHLENSSYGTCRGTGSLQLHDGAWKIEQYNLTIPVPNELSKDLVSRIREIESKEPR